MRFGPYDVIEQVAVGSTGTVYRAQHSDIGRVVALKVLHPALVAVPGMLESFRAEARMLARLDDPHVVAVYDFVEDEAGAWIAEAWVDGATLQAILVAHGRLTPEQSLGALHGALQGLAHAHDRELVHRDLAPSNVLTDLAGTSMLVDFGLAAPVGTTGTCGTPAFMSPEAARGEAVGKTGDVYSAGAVLHLLLSGAPPFPGADAEAVLARHLADPPPVLGGHGPALADLLQRCLAKDPAQRPPDAAALLAELDEAASEHYGADWLTRAGLVGLVAATVELGLGTGGAAVATGTAQAAAEAAAEAIVDTGAATVVVPAAHASTPPTPPVMPTATPHHRRRPRRLKAGPAVVVGVAAVVILGGGAAAVTLTSGGGTPVADSTPTPSTTPTPEPTPTPTPTPSPTPVLTAATAPQGRYRIDIVVTGTDNPAVAVGTTINTIWTVVTSCDVLPCTGTITSEQGAHYTTTWDGTTFVATGTRESPCLYLTTRQPIPGTEGSYHEDIVNTMTATSTTDGVPTLLEGTATQTSTLAHPVANCDAKVYHQQRSITVTRLA